jgi:hypothetical protein
MSTYQQRRLQVLAEAQTRKSSDPSRRKCFVSYHHDDQDEVEQFIEDFGHNFIPRILGVSDEDDFIDSEDTEYIMDQIREKYLTDSTVTIVLIGKCTWARRYVDWEIYSTLRDDTRNLRSGLLAITLPSIADYSDRKLPPRLKENVNGDELYANWWKYPTSDTDLKDWIEKAFAKRTTKCDLIENGLSRKIRNSSCG